MRTFLNSAFSVAFLAIGASCWCLSNADEYRVLYADLANHNTIGYRSHFDMQRNCASSKVSETQGSLVISTDPRDVAIVGSGYFLLKDENGRPYLSRMAKLLVNDSGECCLVDDRLLSATINSMGHVPIASLGQNGIVLLNDIEVGRVDVYVTDDSNIERIELDRLYIADADKLNRSNNCRIMQYCVEESNVDVVRTLLRMVFILAGDQRIKNCEAKKSLIGMLLANPEKNSISGGMLDTCIPFLEIDY